MEENKREGLENPADEVRGTTPENENSAAALLGSMGGKRYTGPEPDGAPAEPESVSAVKSGTGLAGSMGSVRYETGKTASVETGLAGSMGSVRYETGKTAAAETGLAGSMGSVRYETGKPASVETGLAGSMDSVRCETGKPTHVESGLAGSVGGVRYGTKPRGASAPTMEEGLAGSVGGVRYGIRPEPVPAPPAPPEKKKGPDRSVLLALTLAAAAVAASLLLVFWDSLFGGAEMYGMGLGGFINYYKPVEEEEILEEDGVSYVGDQMVVISAAEVPREEMERFLQEQGMEVVGYVELIDTYQVQLGQSYTLKELHGMASELEKDPRVDSATINAVRENTGFAFPSDPWDGNADWTRADPYCANWGMVAIHAPKSWDRWEPEEVRAGVVDSMFDTDHPDLSFAMTKDNEIFDLIGDCDERNHGTHVSGIIGAIHGNGLCSAGVAENCRIYGYSAYQYEGTIEEVSAIAELAAQDVRVINYSMGLVPEIRDMAIERNGVERDIYYHYAAAFSQTALKHLLDKGYDFVLVVAAGNDPVDALWASEYSYITDPEIRSRIIVVGAAGVNPDGSYYQAYWSAFGQRVDVLAPGIDIFSTLPGMGGGYLSGTSMATPHVTGVCASVWAIAPGLNGAQVKNIVVRTATTPVPGGSAGLVNMEAAMEAAQSAR